ncbi:MAG TPA: pyrimidine 5'-nucleotidase [Hellea balneolensis]|uniref:Pyrimidine 5'-nucleotidase n=1 Tax=Hellea balneolensis TaxID=287478 RepID=A0A7C5QQL2_9PROT|nr:pyrimidine 5'-nucleotidase [Hellea balneolensis]
MSVQPLSHIETWIFDLDNTLYTAGAGFFRQIEKKITNYISRYLALHPREALILQKQYLAEYGTSLSGMMDVHGMDPADFLDYVHDVDLGFLTPNPDLRTALQALPGQKYIFTNGSRGHAKNVGEHLNIYDVFDGVFALEDGDYIPKPKSITYERFVQDFQVDPGRAVMVEDMARNLSVPKQMGMTTVLLKSHENWDHEPLATRPHVDQTVPAHVDYVTDDLAKWLTQMV